MHEVSRNIENDYEEPADADLRAQLGLRPIYYSSSGVKGSHPDQRPCPSWCWIGQSDEYEHEVIGQHPMSAIHTLEGTPSIVASQYWAPRHKLSGDGVGPATIEFHLDQVGQGDPVVKVYLRAHEAGSTEEERRIGFAEVLRLSLTDAEELATVLQHLVRLAEG